MIETAIDQRVKISQLIEGQLPEYVASESPLFVDFLKQYYQSQQFQSGPVDLLENIDQYIKLDNLTPDALNGRVGVTESVSASDTTIHVDTTKGFPNEYGLIKIDDEIITYTGVTTNTFTGCIRGFSGITSYRSGTDSESLVFNTSTAASHTSGVLAENLSTLFLKEFFRKLKISFAPGLEDQDFTSSLDVNNFIKSLRGFYEAKGTSDSFRILMRALYNVSAKVIDLEQLLSKPSTANYRNRLTLITDLISGDPETLVGKTLFQDANTETGVGAASAPISEVETFTIQNKKYYKISLFFGYESPPSGFFGNYKQPGKSKVIGTYGTTADTITVDSTLGFPAAGEAVVGNNTIRYTEKTVNQFLGVSGITESIEDAADIRENLVVYGYSDGTTNKVELRLTGILNKFNIPDNYKNADVNEEINVKFVGKKVRNPDTKTYIETFFNSWEYNPTNRVQIESFTGSAFKLALELDRVQIRTGDTVQVLARGSNTVLGTAQITIDNSITATADCTLSGSVISTLNPNTKYDIRRLVKKATSSDELIKNGENVIVSDIQNTYISNDDSYGFVASNSLPSYEITTPIISKTLTEASSSSGGVQELDSNGQYSILAFDTEVPFITGDEVIYRAGTASTTLGMVEGYTGVKEGRYFVEVQPDPKKIKLCVARSFIDAGDFVKFAALPAGSGSHVFTLASQADKQVEPQVLLKKFPLVQDLQSGDKTVTSPGPVGILRNGVEILNPRSEEFIYYGPVSSVSVLNGGSNFDVLNPPSVIIGNPPVSTGTTALVEPVVVGKIVDVSVDPQSFDITEVFSISVSGANGKNSQLEPIVENRYREVAFNAANDAFGGGIGTSTETITFLDEHNFVTGQQVVYDRNGNTALGIGTFGGGNEDTGLSLNSGGSYFISKINNKSVYLYQSINDLNAGINTIGFTTVGTSGIHKFRTFDQKKTLTGVRVINGGEGFASRRLRVKATGVSTSRNTITFTDHGFANGEIVSYAATTGTAISGLNTNNQYYILNASSNSFQLSDAGVGGTIRDNYNRSIPVNFTSTGSGYQEFNYPTATVSINVAYANTVGVITATPSIRGSVEKLFLYEAGSDYGSKIVDFQKRPLVSVVNGTEAQLNPIISNGKIISVQILSGGRNYKSAPDLKVVSNSGSGAKLRAIVSGGAITKVIIQSTGIGYDTLSTNIVVTTLGAGLVVNTSVRKLTINKTKRFEEYGGEFLFSNEVIKGLEYSILGYNDDLRTAFFDTDTNTHSPLIGWAYDGNPIYGSYGYSDPEDSSSGVIRLSSGYTLNTGLVLNRPSGFAEGFFIEDYEFNASGQLDEHNGRFCKTVDYPNGVYAYFATSDIDPSTGGLIAQYPYFVGQTYRTTPLVENLYGRESINQNNFDFDSGEYSRNTYPYLLGEEKADNDYILESYELATQKAIVESVSSGTIESVSVLSPGDRYAVNEPLYFDESASGGEGLDVVVSEIRGKEVVELNTNFRDYSGFVFEKTSNQVVTGTIGTYHDLRNGDTVVISGLSTFVRGLSGKQVVGVVSATGSLTEQLNAGSAGDVVDLRLSRIPNFVSVGSSILIGAETFKVLNKIPVQNILRVERSGGGISTTGIAVSFLPNSFTINLETDDFESTTQDTVFFNASETVGIATTSGISATVSYTQAGVTSQRDVPAQTIFIEDHPFTTNQSVVLTTPSTGQPFVVRAGYGDTQYLPSAAGVAQTVFVVNVSKDLIGLKTSRAGEQLFFLENAQNSDDYKFVSEFAAVTGTVRKIETTVATASTHLLETNDLITFKVKPKGAFGIGAASSVSLSYNSLVDSVVVNSVGFNSTGINTATNRITIASHGLLNGDKIVYEGVETAEGLINGAYFVYVIDENTFSLAKTRVDLNAFPPILVDITGIGATHTIGRINPQIPVIRDRNLVFDLTDSSLTGYKLKFFYDKEFNNPVISIGSSTVFDIQETGVVGSTGITTVGFSSAWPSKLYYNLEKSGYLSTSDVDVNSFSEISYSDSKYNGSFRVTGIGSTTFTVALVNQPETTRYIQNDCAELRYTTKSRSSNGGIEKVNIVSPGFGFDSRPNFVGVGSTSTGINAILEAASEQIGKVNSTRIVNAGFEYPSDKTLTAAALIPSWSQVANNYTVSDGNIFVKTGGKNFTNPPQLVLVDSTTGKDSGNGSYNAVMNENSINSIEVLKQPTGLAGVAHTLYTLSNSNGIIITNVDSVPSGIVTVTIQTPVLGFTTAPVAIGDKIFVDGISQYFSGDFDGHNSKDHGFKFFEVTNVNAAVNPVTVTYSLAGIATQNVGVAVSDTNNTASLVKQDDYPTFTVNLEREQFLVNEKIQVDIGNGYFDTDLVVVKSQGDILKVKGAYQLKVGDKVHGSSTGFVATILVLQNYEGTFRVSYDVEQAYGWADRIGFTNDDLALLPDNNYYQNLSYTVQSPLEWNTLVGPMNRLLHSSGMKNFADMEIKSPVSAAATVGVNTSIVGTSIIVDYIFEGRVDQINTFDLASDIDVVNNVSPAIKMQNKKLSSFIKCVTNRVLLIDDISKTFSSKELNERVSQKIVTYPSSIPFQRLLVLAKDVNNLFEYQFTELIVLNTTEGVFTLQKSDTRSSDDEVVTFAADIDDAGIIDISATPIAEGVNYDFKVVRQLFDSNVGGVATLSLGIASVTGVTTSVGIGSVLTLFSGNTADLEGFTAHVAITRPSDQYGNYHEVVVEHDGTDTYLAEFGYDTGYTESGVSTAFFGTFRSYVDSGVIKLDYTNNSDEEMVARVRVVGLNDISLGVSTQSFKLDIQDTGTERSARYQSSGTSDTITGAGYAITAVGFSTDNDLAAKSLVRVAIGNSVNVSQLIFSADKNTNIGQLIEYPQLTVGDDVVGLGSFGTEFDGTQFNVMFYPDAHQGVATITGYHEVFYRDKDSNADTIPNIVFGRAIDEYSETFFNRGDQLNFELTSNGYPIYAKTFDPAKVSTLNTTTGVFTIKNHFFNTGQELEYIPESTVVGVTPVALSIGSTLSGGGNGVGDLIIGFATVTGLTTTGGMAVSQEFIGPGVPSGSTIVSIGSSAKFFVATSDGSTLLTGVGNTSIFALNETIVSDTDYTGFGTITAIGINSITVANNVPAGVGSAYYSTALAPSVTISSVGSATTIRQTFRSGITTDIIPSTVFAIKETEDTFKLATKKDFALAGIGMTYTATGQGNAHVLDTTKKLEKSLISLDGVNQAPIAFANLTFELRESVSSATTSFPISGISSVKPGDLLKIGQEYMSINNVGLGTTAGDISGIGTFFVVNVLRGAVGSAASAKTDGDVAKIYRGSYNIVRNKIHFTNAPSGTGAEETFNESNLSPANATFGGRVYMRSDYTNNALFIDVSNQFTGLARTFTLQTDQDNPVGFETGGSVVFLNGIFQAPTTLNNSGKSYTLESTVAGITSAVFNGVRLVDGSPYVDERDINNNEIPRGGIIVSLGSTGGTGVAPLVGAKFRALTSEGGGISGVVGVGTTTGRPGLGIVTASYNELTGIMEVETTTPHKFVGTGQQVYMIGLEFACASAHSGVTTTIFPDGTRGHVFEVIGVGSTTIFTADIGISTIAHEYVGSGEVFKFDTEINTGSGYRGPVAIAITDPGYAHRFVSAEDNSIYVTSFDGSTLTPTSASYEPTTGEFTLTIADHGLTTLDSIGIKTGAIVFVCDEDNYTDKQSYPRATDPIAGVITPITAASPGSITINVGTAAGFNAVASATVGAGGTLDITVSAAGTGYVNPQIIIPDPTYSNMSIEGVSRLGIGSTTDTGFGCVITLQSGAGSTTVDDEYHFINGFTLNNPGYGFRKGDVFRPVGLVSAVGAGTAFSEFELTVESVYTDSFSAWQFGQIDYIDSVKDLQNGTRRRFPLYQNSQLLSFQKDEEIAASAAIDLANVLLIFVDGVIQVPGEAYEFDGGTSFTFTQAPSAESDIEIFFYRGTSGTDSFQTAQSETIKAGDTVTLRKLGQNDGTVTQDSRLVQEVASADKITTNIYINQGIDETVFRPLDWRKQKSDKIINTEIVTKTRDSLEPLVYPTARLIGDLSDGATDIFVDNARFFQYEEYADGAPANTVVSTDLIVIDSTENVGASITALVGGDGTLTFDIVSGGSGYAGTSVALGIAAPPRVDNAKYGIIGVGTTAVARGIISSGSITSVDIYNAGGGYSIDAPPNVLIPNNTVKTDVLDNADIILGFVGVITGIAAASGLGGATTAIEFQTDYTNSLVSTAELDSLIVGYPIYVYDTTVGSGITAIDVLDTDTVGIGTTFVDAVYKVAGVYRDGNLGVITCNILSTTDTVGFGTTGTLNVPVGRFSWGRIGQGSRNAATAVSFAVSSFTTNAGLSTYPIVQRRGFGLRNSGALKKQVSN